MITLPAVTVVGTLTADAELRFTPNGVAVANFSIATNDRKKNKQTGEWEDGDATFLRGSVWRDYAENVAESLTRGTRVIAVGQLRQRSYEKDGETRTVYELDVEEIGPALKWAKAVVTKVSGGGKSSGQVSARASTFRQSGGAADDPWGGGPSAPSDGEPPF